jgi:DNA end-binding protein Ku
VAVLLWLKVVSLPPSERAKRYGSKSGSPATALLEGDGMARAIWKGHISFGLVNIPVKLYSAITREELAFRFLHKKDNAPINYERVCEKEGREVPWNEVVRGYEYEKGKFVVLTEEDFKRADVEATRTVDILDFVDAEDVDMMYFDRPYYLQPDRGSEKPYVLLREALAKSGKIGIAKVVIRTRQHLAALKPVREALVLNLMRFQNELVDVSELELPEEADVNEKELRMAEQLIENLSQPFDPAKYTDDYRAELLRVIQEKIEGRPAPPIEEEEPSPQVIDIMSALKASLEHTRRRSADGAKGRSEDDATRSGEAKRRRQERAQGGVRDGSRRSARAVGGDETESTRKRATGKGGDGGEGREGARRRGGAARPEKSLRKAS